MKYIQRPNYFTSQFLVEKDFNDEQAYHRDMRLRHNSLLHDWGVVEGLEVTRAGQKKIAVSEGMAIDKYGREIIVLPDCTVPDTINTINLDGLELEPNTTTTIEITVIYDEIKDDGDEVAVGNDKKYTRTTERPKFVIYGSKTSKDNLQDGNVDVKTGFAPTDDNVILLARVTLDNNGEVSENAVDNSVRKLAGPKLSNLDKLELDGTISAENLNLTGNSTIDGSLTVNGNLEVKGDVIARDTEHIAGDVSLGDADNHEVKVTGVIRSGHSSGALRVDDGLHTTGALTVDGNVGIGTNNPRQKLEVAGTVKATRFEGDGSGLTGIGAGKWSDGGSNGIYYNHGNVGIGTNSTYAELTVNGSIGFANGTAPMMYIHQSGTNNAPRPIIAHSPRYRNWGVEYRDHEDLMVFQGSGQPVLSVGLRSKKVGIGITNPTEKLEVDGTVKATRFEGDGSGLTGISAGGTKWSDGSNNSIYYNHGNVGICTNRTYAELTVNGSIGFANGTAPMMYIHQRGTNNAPRPIIAHSPSHPNWGVEYRDHEDLMVFQGSGEPVLSVALRSKKVGIGITNPTEKLEVAGTVKATRFEGDGSGLTGIRAGSETKWYDGSNNSIYYNHGNVGIGTNSTYAELTVNGSIGFANGTAPMMYIHQSGTNNAPRPIIAHSPRYRNWGVEYREHGDLMVFQGSGEPVLSVGLGSKKVGIGITNPTEKLEVVGTVKATRFEGDGSGLTGISAGGTKWSDGGSNRIYYNAGNVGIGTNNPTQKLEVAGTVKAIATHTGRDSAYGVYSQAHGSDSGSKFGLYAQATGGSSGTRFGVYGGASGGSAQYGGYFTATHTGNRTAYGVQSVVSGNGNGTKYGLHAQATGGSSGTRFGVYGNASGGQTQYGGYFIATNRGNTNAFGVWSQVAGNGNGTKFGLHAQATGGSSGARFGVRGIASGGQTQYGGHFTATNTGNTTAFGVHSTVTGNENGTKYGLYARATGGPSGTRFGVYGRADAQNNSSAIVYGVYGVASGGKTSYAGYFEGNVHVNGHLTYRTIGQVSSRELKENINTLAIEDAIETLEGLNPVQFSYKKDHQKETHIGFIAEDVPDLVASHDRKTLSPMDIVAVLTKVVKEQNNTISLLMEKVQTLEQKSQSSAF
ncbi:hypothetical protein LYNGBM3L_03900 [Moorena producens 3L]|uniref:Peptidase S74 domain-containing protein n=1 Tax=Moorena producens 3L TaxID=489825 RepID=F4XIV9_9CYAN|nr:tail fiber domain-containing protein [Moorena producens]EGJ35416.1 hypothetical protein LYNGBM3L_03900 [Moorena producens 3L]OLT64894.1 hypothetical protein BI334_07490 [Moorena producens 3L]